MEAESDGRDRLTQAIRWTARVWALATFAVVVLLSFGEGIHPAGAAEVAGLVLYPGGICLGLTLAWWREGLGGSITVASLLLFYVLHATTAGRLPAGLGWLVLAFPGLLFLWCWRRAAHSSAAPA